MFSRRGLAVRVRVKSGRGPEKLIAKENPLEGHQRPINLMPTLIELSGMLCNQGRWHFGQ